MPDRTHDFLIDLIGAQDDASGQGCGVEPQLVELMLDRRMPSSAQRATDRKHRSQGTVHARR